ncbi:MAG: ferredoxin [Oscillospiraceae bacterium]|nr:ferredoxin [Oscillospiraceae bacterium]
MNYHVTVNERCFGCKMCAVICPQVFRIDEHGYAKVIMDPVSFHLEDDLDDAIRACSAHAISYDLAT